MADCVPTDVWTGRAFTSQIQPLQRLRLATGGKMTTLIRRAESGDIESICRADARAFGEGQYGEARDKADRSNWREQRIQRLKEWYQYHYRETFVAVVDGKVVGFAGYRPVEGNTGIIHNNAVDPEYQDLGISTRLVKRVVEELTALGVARIKVGTAHVPAAIRVYQKAGFGIVEQHGPRTSLELTVV